MEALFCFKLYIFRLSHKSNAKKVLSNLTLEIIMHGYLALALPFKHGTYSLGNAKWPISYGLEHPSIVASSEQSK